MEPIESIGQWPKNDLPDLVKEFALWLVTPSWERVPSSQNQWAKEHDRTPGVVSRWKQDLRFQKYLSKLADEYNLAPDRVQNVMNALYESATTGKDVKAMQLYLQHAEKLQPKRVVVEDARIQSMTDEEIAAEIAGFAADV